MARRRTSRSKIQPAPLTIAVSFPILPSSFETRYCDISQMVSLLSRRFYRQGLNWAVAGFKALNVDGMEGALQISKLPNSWVMSNSWEKCFRSWTKMNNEALAESESVRPKFLDFKIYADSDHHQLGYALNLLPLSGAGVPATPGMWESSKFQIPDTTSASGVQDREIIAVGANYPGVSPITGLNAVSLIEGYAASRALPDVFDPNTPSDALRVDGSTPQNWIAATFSDGTQQTDAVITDMVTENNQAPYPYEDDGTHTDTMYPGGANQLVGLEFHDVEYFTPTTISNTIRLKGGNFPCGLIRFDAINNSEQQKNVTILIDMIPGNHRGYLCEPMTEM